MSFKNMILKGNKTKIEHKLNSKEFSELKLKMNIEIKKKNFGMADKLQKEFNSKWNELKYRFDQEAQELINLKEIQLKRLQHQQHSGIAA